MDFGPSFGKMKAFVLVFSLMYHAYSAPRVVIDYTILHLCTSLQLMIIFSFNLRNYKSSEKSP